VKDPALRERLQGTLPPAGNPAFKSIVTAPVLLALCGKLKSSGYYKDTASTKFGDWFMFDLGIAAQTFCLTARHFGMGTVIVGQFDHDKAGAILNVPEDHELVALIPVGYPVKFSKAPKRRTLDAFVHVNSF